jgi:Flp pilus assembly pilin Flp
MQGLTCPSDRRRNLQMYEVLMRPIVALQVKVDELREREDGQTTTEYAILLGFLAIAIIIALYFLRGVLRDLFSEAASSVSNAPN